MTPEFVQSLRHRLVLSSWMERDIRLVRKGKDLWGLCPFHGEKTPSLKIDDARGHFHCFGCGIRGDVFSYIQERQGMGFVEAVKEVAEFLGVPLPDKKESPHLNATVHKASLKAAAFFFQEHLRLFIPAQEYLKRRSIFEKTQEDFGLGYAPSGDVLKRHLQNKGFSEKILCEAGLTTERGRDRFWNRLMFPITNARGEVVAFGGRTLSEEEPKYLNSPETFLFQKRSILYGYDKASRNVSKAKGFICVEGYFDVISLHQNGFSTAVAPLGTSLSEDHLDQLWRKGATPTLCFDGDEAGEKAAFRAFQKALPYLEPEKTLQWCVLPSKDPDGFLHEQGRESFEKYLGASYPLSEGLWRALFKECPERENETPEEKAKRQELGHTWLKTIGHENVRRYYQKDFWQRLKHYENRQRKVFSPQVPLNSIPSNEHRHREAQKVLLVTLINHPKLMNSVADDLGRVQFSYPQAESLRLRLLEMWFEREQVLPPEELRTFNWENIYRKAPFARPEASEEDALRGWSEVWKRTFLKPELEREILETTIALKRNFEESLWNQLKRLKSERDFLSTPKEEKDGEEKFN